jgi:UDP-glucose 6-dehydrogenase
MIINTLADFDNIGPSHMRVKELGYDGNCFPKDMEAFAEFLDSDILKNVIEVNKSLVASR